MYFKFHTSCQTWKQLPVLITMKANLGTSKDTVGPNSYGNLRGDIRRRVHGDASLDNELQYHPGHDQPAR